MFTDASLSSLCLRALKAARPYVIDGRGPREDSKRVGTLLDEALAKLGEPQVEADWD